MNASWKLWKGLMPFGAAWFFGVLAVKTWQSAVETYVLSIALAPLLTGITIFLLWLAVQIWRGKIEL